MEVVKIVKVDNTKIKRIKPVAKTIARPAPPLIQLKRPVPNAALANTKTKPTKPVVNPIATPAPRLIQVKRPVPNAAMANTKIKTIKPVVKLAMMDISPTLLKLDVSDVL